MSTAATGKIKSYRTNGWIDEPIRHNSLTCYNCKQETNQTIIVSEYSRENRIYGYKNLHYCKDCFKNWLNE